MDRQGAETGRRGRQFWLVFAFCWLVWGGLYALHLREVKGDPPVSSVLLWAYSDALLWALATPLVWWFAARFPIRRPHVVRNVLVHCALAPVVALGVLSVDASLTSSGGPFDIPSLRYRVHSNLLIYASLVAIQHWLGHQRRLRETERKVDALRAQIAEARLEALRTKLQPHFLFNCLNTISGLVPDRPQEAQRMIAELARLLRLVLRSGRGELVPLRDEVGFVDSYLELEKARFGARLWTSVDVAPECRELLVPAVMLQPLVENAVRHGVAPREGGGGVEVEARREGDRLLLAVRDDGVGLASAPEEPKGPREPGERQGIGLSSVRSRLSLLFGEQQSCRLRERPRGGTEVCISIPALEAGSS